MKQKQIKETSLKADKICHSFVNVTDKRKREFLRMTLAFKQKFTQRFLQTAPYMVELCKYQKL